MHFTLFSNFIFPLNCTEIKEIRVNGKRDELDFRLTKDNLYKSSLFEETNLFGRSFVQRILL